MKSSLHPIEETDTPPPPPRPAVLHQQVSAELTAQAAPKTHNGAAMVGKWELRHALSEIFYF